MDLGNTVLDLGAAAVDQLSTAVEHARLFSNPGEGRFNRRVLPIENMV